MPLSLVSDLCPSLTDEIVKKLLTAKINTIIVLCRTDSARLRQISENCDINYHTLVKIKSELMQKYAPKQRNAFDIFKDLKKRIAIYKTGILSLDQILDNGGNYGGIYSGEITEIIGNSASGKSQFCMAFASTVVTETSKEVLYIDTELSFSAKRVHQIIECRLKDNANDTKIMESMNRVNTCTVFDTIELLNMIETIGEDLDKNDLSSRFANTGVIIIDSLAAPLMLTLNKIYFKASNERDEKKSTKISLNANRIVTQLGNSLQSLALRHSIAIVVINYPSFPLPREWNNFPALTMNISKLELMNGTERIRQIQVTQSVRLFDESNNKGTFVIRKSGMRTFECVSQPQSSSDVKTDSHPLRCDSNI